MADALAAIQPEASPQPDDVFGPATTSELQTQPRQPDSSKPVADSSSCLTPHADSSPCSLLARMIPLPASVEDCDDADDHQSTELGAMSDFTASSDAALSLPDNAPPAMTPGQFSGTSNTAMPHQGSPAPMNASPGTTGFPKMPHEPPEELNGAPRPHLLPRMPSALTYLNADSPSVTPEAIRWAAQGGIHQTHREPRQVFSAGQPPMEGSPHIERFSKPLVAASSQAWVASPMGQPDQGLHDIPLPKSSFRPPQPSSQIFVPPFESTRLPPSSPMHPNHVPHGDMYQQSAQFPPPDEVPMSGYQLLAAKLAGGLSGPPIKPIYRRFEALNHRLLLHMQDELCELEEQLHNLDSADTRARWLPHGIMPAGRRRWIGSQDDLAMQRMNILGNIGFRLDLYQRVMASFNTAQSFPMPTISQIEQYRSYLDTARPIAETETRFLDFTDDLATIGSENDYSPSGRIATTDDLTPVPCPAEYCNLETRGVTKKAQSEINGAPWAARESASRDQFLPTAVAVVLALIVPIVTFLVISDFSGRMAIVFLAACAVLTVAMETGTMRSLAGRFGMVDWLVWTALYGGTMSVIAASFK